MARITVTRVLAGLCMATSALTLIPGLRTIVGDGATSPAVRMMTAPFVHGFSTASMIPHLAGNMLLLLYAGSRVEERLGVRRFVLLTAGALLAYTAIQLVVNLEVNGASVFIWAYAPPLAVIHTSSERPARAGPAGVVLVVMWIIVPVLMTTVPYAFGWSGSVASAFLVANAFHLSATIAGLAAAWVWRKELRRRPSSEQVS